MDDFERLRNLLFAVRVSYRYHKSRESFFETLARTSKVVTVVSSSAVFVALLDAAPTELAKWAALLLALVQAIDLIFAFGEKASDYNALARKFMQLQSEIVPYAGRGGEVNAAVVGELERKKMQIEMEEPATLYWLSVIAYNGQIDSQSSLSTEGAKRMKIPVPRYQRPLSHFINLAPRR